MHSKYKRIVRNSAIAAGAIGVPGAFSFGADVAAISATWVTMMIAMANAAGRTMDSTTAAKVVAGVLAGASSYYVGSKIATSTLNAIPIAGNLAAVLTNSSLNALFTYRLGNALSSIFDRPDFNVQDVKLLIANLLNIFGGKIPTQWGPLARPHG